MNINSERLWNNIQQLGKIGQNENGGVTRLAFTKEEREAKQVVTRFMENAGLQVREDGIGNLIGKKEGLDPKAPVIMIGSHIDSVFNGGIFDGPAGVLTGIEVLHTLNEKGIEANNPIEVIAFTDEEGARFSTGMLGSKAIAGQLTDEDLFGYRDQDGHSVAEAMKLAGYDHQNIPSVKREGNQIKQYIELHIEQGKILESENLPVGVVTGIVGVAWLKVTLQGEAGHAGTTPMYLRKDPLAAAAKIMTFAEELAKTEDRTVVTVGRMQTKPGGVNIIPATVEFTFDIRDISESIIEKVESSIREFINQTCEDRGITYEIEVLHRLPSAKSSERLIKLVEESIEGEGIKPLQLVSGAGHDAMIMSTLTDSVMIFVRSKDGISHNPKEWTEQNDLAMGAEVLYKTILKLI